MYDGGFSSRCPVVVRFRWFSFNFNGGGETTTTTALSCAIILLRYYFMVGTIICIVLSTRLRRNVGRNGHNFGKNGVVTMFEVTKQQVYA